MTRESAGKEGIDFGAALQKGSLNRCEPPLGTPSGTMHKLSHPCLTPKVKKCWRNGRWIDIERSRCLTPEEAAINGWVYTGASEGPACDPPTLAMNVYEAAVVLRNLLSVKSRWTKRSAAKDVNGKRVWPNNERAVCWCLLGGIAKVASPRPSETQPALERMIEDEIGGVHVGEWNDDPKRTHADVVKVLDNVVDKAKEVLTSQH